MTALNDKLRFSQGVGAVFLGRLGALIEAFAFVAFAWLYGAETYGLYAVLWAYVKVMSAITEGGMTTALQRFIPQANQGQADQQAGTAIKFSFLLGCALATLMTIFAPYLNTYVNASAEVQPHMVLIIQIYSWVLPFWTFIEVSTAAVRATKNFGPEIRVRIFIEQGIRLIAGVAFALSGYEIYGLFYAHLLSVIIAALFGLRLVSRHYNMPAALRASFNAQGNKEILSFGINILPANLCKMLFSELPVILLNHLLPGAQGTAASGYYAIARKIASVLQMLRKTFDYVLSPFSSEKIRDNNKSGLDDLAQFSTRISSVLAVQICGFLIAIHAHLLSAMPEEFMTASTAVIILCIARLFEVFIGPSGAIIEMVGNKRLPFLNNLIGISMLCGLSYILIPDYGLMGAAIGAAIGINTSALLALFQVKRHYDITLHAVAMRKPVVFLCLLVCTFYISAQLFHGLGNIVLLINYIVFFILNMMTIFFAVLSEEDQIILGRFRHGKKGS